MGNPMLEFIIEEQKKDDERRRLYKEYNKRREARYPGYASIAGKKWREKHPGYASANSKKWRDDNPDYNKKYSAKNSERILVRTKEWQAKNRERCLNYQAEWRAKNPEYAKAWRETCVGRTSVQRGHIVRRDRERKLANTLTFDEWLEILEDYRYKCAYCGESFSHSNLPTIDHIIPISRGGNNVKENVAPACRSCNSKKGVRLVEEIIKK